MSALTGRRILTIIKEAAAEVGDKEQAMTTIAEPPLEGFLLTPSMAGNIPRGSLLRLRYAGALNGGLIWWLHAKSYRSVDGQMVMRGAYSHDPNRHGFSPVDDYLYEGNGRMCRGSGADFLTAVGVVLPKGSDGKTLLAAISELEEGTKDDSARKKA